MDEIKRRVLDLIARDRIVPGDHYLQRMRERDITIPDAIAVLRSGVRDRRFEEQDPSGMIRHRFRGRDGRGRNVAVVVIVDELRDELKLITEFKDR